jgi:predicted dehydrogenase
MVAARDAGGAARRLRLGMVGGGQGAFIGASTASPPAWMTGGSWSPAPSPATPERARASAAELHVAPDRAYADYREMARAEAARADGIDAVSIVTPNASHHAIARAFLDAGIHVICDKPLTTTLEDARDLVRAVQGSGRVFVLTHNYTGYPMVRQAQAMVAEGLSAPSAWCRWNTRRTGSHPVEDSGMKQAAWRVDPAQAGPAGSLGDLGTHAHNLAEFVTALQVEQVCADLTAFVEGRALDDNAHLLLRFSGGARGMLWSSQVSPGNENALRLRVYGERAGIEWSQEAPNQLRFAPLGEPPRILARGTGGLHAAAAHATRIPAGHPEGYLEAFAQLYRDVAERVAARIEGRDPDPAALLVPGVEEGVRGVRFLAAAVESNRRGGAWQPV